MLPLLQLLLFLPGVSLLETLRVKRLSAYDPANLLLPYKDDTVPKQTLRVYRPMLNVVLAKEARTTKVNGKEIPLWLGDGFVRIPKRPVLSTVVVVPTSAEQDIESVFTASVGSDCSYQS
ncbi:hypothetical protein V3C99_011493 [Haemonchus contortus]|uniref:Secreted protein n=1 Tax=Haemonchus contortus TaxID=6289 RepID=A0A7I5E7U6_HAECO